MANIPSFVTIENDSLIFTPKNENQEFVAYIPEKFFERGIAEQVGEFINLYGVFDYTIEDLSTGKNIGLKNFALPTLFSTIPNSIEKKKQLTLIKTSDPMDYRIMRYKTGDTLMVSTKVTQSVDNVEKVINLFTVLGYIPNTISYDKIYDYFVNAMKLNGYSFGLNGQVVAFIVSELCRSFDNPSIPYRLSKSTDPHAYKSMSIKNISKQISPYTALLSEDFDESVMYAMMNDEPESSSLEKIFIGDVKGKKSAE